MIFILIMLYLLPLTFYCFIGWLVYKLFLVHHEKEPIFISIEGNIGSGKTTLINLIKNEFKNVDIVEEPVNTWLSTTDNNGLNILDAFYKDKKRWAYIFQNFAYITRIKNLVDTFMNSNKDFIISERSIECDKNVFCKMLKDSKDITDLEYNIYESWYNVAEEYILPEGKKYIIYLRTTPENSYSRIFKRNRVEEKTIGYDYIEKVHEYHENWLNDTNVLELDGNVDFESDGLNRKITLNYIRDFLQDIKNENNNTIIDRILTNNCSDHESDGYDYYTDKSD